VKHEKEFTEAAEAWVEKLVPTKRVVWMRPTRASPMCRYTITPKAQRVVSECGVWLTAVVRGAMREDVVERDRCPLCATGRRAAGVEERRK
jgi:hypothetical protein